MDGFNYSATEYPKIFQHTYWGRFEYDGNHNSCREIIQNRNNFVRDFEIKKECKGTCPKWVEKNYWDDAGMKKKF